MPKICEFSGMISAPPSALGRLPVAQCLAFAAALFLAAAGPEPAFSPSIVDGVPVVVRPDTPICETQQALHEALLGHAPQNCLVFRQPIPASLDRPLKDALPEDRYTLLLPGGAIVEAWTLSRAVGP